MAKKKHTSAKRMPQPLKKKVALKVLDKKVKSGQGFIENWRTQARLFLGRRPHRSFRLTHRRDYKRSLKLPGYWSLTVSVARQLGRNKNTFLLLGAVYVAISLLMVGMASQDNFTELQNTLTEVGQEIYEGDFTAMGTATALTISAIIGGISPNLSEVQQLYMVILGLIVWLTTVWLLRQYMAGHTPRLRDGLYSAGAPIVPTFLLALAMVVQLLPVALVVIGFSAATTSGLLDGGVEAMLFWGAATGLTTLSVYWITSTALAMVIVTLPGMYPMKALKIAGDMAVGRRLRIILRLAWMTLLLLVAWILVLIPVILLDMGVKNAWEGIQWLPVVPFVIVILGMLSLMWAASYVYILYRGIVDDDTQPA